MVFSWLSDEVRNLYDDRTDRPGIDPEVAVTKASLGGRTDAQPDKSLPPI